MAGCPNAVGRGVDDFGMPEIICNHLLNLQAQEHPILFGVAMAIAALMVHREG
jgi:hypothetical protein